MPFPNPVAGGGGDLIRERLRSPNYVAGVSGWSINQAGTAEFNSVTVRGEFEVRTGDQVIRIAAAGFPKIFFNPDEPNFFDGWIYALTSGGGTVGELTLVSPYPVNGATSPATLTLISDVDGTSSGRKVVVSAEFQDGPIMAADPNWTAISLAGGYNAGITGFSPGWRWVSPTTVELRGEILKGSGAGGGGANGFGNGDQPFQLPAGPRPTKEVRFPVGCQARASNFAVGEVRIGTAGFATFQTSAAHDPGFIYLDTVRYDIT